MKKRYLVLFVLLVILSGCSRQTKTTPLEDRVTGIVSINYDELMDKMENNHDFLLYIGRADCQDCIAFYPELALYMENHPTAGIYYLDIKAFRDAAHAADATQQEKDFFANLTSTLEIDWVPTLQHRQGKQVIEAITYLDENFFELETEDQKEQARQDSLEAITNWLDRLSLQVDAS